MSANFRTPLVSSPLRRKGCDGPYSRPNQYLRRTRVTGTLGQPDGLNENAHNAVEGQTPSIKTPMGRDRDAHRSTPRHTAEAAQIERRASFSRRLCAETAERLLDRAQRSRFVSVVRWCVCVSDRL